MDEGYGKAAAEKRKKLPKPKPIDMIVALTNSFVGLRPASSLLIESTEAYGKTVAEKRKKLLDKGPG